MITYSKLLLKNNFAIIFCLFLFLIAIFLGFLIRIEGFASGNILFLYDNARDLLYVNKIVVDHKPLLIGPSSGGLQGYFHGVFWYYFLILPFLLGNGNPLFFTGFMVFFSILSVLIAFFIFKKVSGFYAAVCIGIVFSLANFSIDTTRFIWNPYPIVWLMPIYFLSLYLFSQKKRYAFVLLAFLTSIFIHLEAIYGICLLPTLFIATFIEIKRVYFRKDFLPFVVALVVFCIPFAPSLLFDLRHDFLITRSLSATVASGGQSITHGPGEVEIPILTRIIERGKDFYMFTIQSITPNTILNIFLFLLFLYGIVVIWKSKKENKKVLLILCFVTLFSPFVIFLFMKYSVWSYYWIGNPPLYACLVVFVCAAFIKTLQKKMIKVFILIFFVLLITAYKPLQSISKNFYTYVDPGYNNLQTQLQIVKTIQTDTIGKPYSVYVLTPPVYDYVYRYLFLLKNHTDHFPLPQDKKQKNIYLILEPSSSDPTGNFFKKHTIRTSGEPRKTFKFPGDIRVEKIIKSTNEPDIDNRFLPQI